jgi:PIN domain
MRYVVDTNIWIEFLRKNPKVRTRLREKLAQRDPINEICIIPVVYYELLRGGQTPDWHIDFDPDSVECTTWDNVFHVRERIKRDVLDSSFWQWLRDFSAWFKKRMRIADPGDAEVVDAMCTYAEDMALTGLTAREFLRAPVFQMLHRHCKAGNQRVLALMKDVVAMAVP